MTDLEFSLLDPMNQADVDAWMDLLDRSSLTDMPDFPLGSPASRIVGLVRRSRATKVEYLLAKRDGQIVAVAEMYLPQLDNRHLVEVELDVDPRFRRRGIGTALVNEVERRARSQERRSVISYVGTHLDGGPARPEAGQAFARARGYVAGLDEVHRVADLLSVAPETLDTLLAEAWGRAEGYELVQWTNHAPDDVVDGVAYLDGRLNIDAPTGTLDYEKANVDARRIREQEADRIRRGQLALSTGVRHKETGALAGWTDIVVNPTDETHAWQGITIVDPDHRGHRIGTILKIANHRLLAEYRPKMRYVHTWNAEVNDYMININEAVGYRAVDRWVGFQKKLDE